LLLIKQTLLYNVIIVLAKQGIGWVRFSYWVSYDELTAERAKSVPSTVRAQSWRGRP
jgi:hypothetical protein